MSNIDFLKSLSDLEQDSEIILYDFDLTVAGGGIIRLHSGVNEFFEPVVWRGKKYEPFPIEDSGDEWTSEGALPRLEVTLSNIHGFVLGLMNDLGDIRGAEVTKRITSAKYLDAVNFKKGNPHASPLQEEVFYYTIERAKSITRDAVVLELAAPVDTSNQIDGQQIHADICTATYRDPDSGCPYNGPPVADEYDIATKDPKKDRCSKRLQGCMARFGEAAVYPIPVAPSVDKVFK